ncbi:MAG: hypothetical protein M1335_06790 [Chloroflexi bacterium]|nr:hypothetical protein [Chloroflexota bacterium]
MRYSSSTDVGVRRSSNEDAYLANGTVFAVADGMGGHLAGEVASGIAIDCLGDLGGARASERTLLNRFERANTIIYDRARADADRRGMGTTLTACLVDENRLYNALWTKTASTSATLEIPAFIAFAAAD